jgi:hypothetical protein
VAIPLNKDVEWRRVRKGRDASAFESIIKPHEAAAETPQ